MTTLIQTLKNEFTGKTVEVNEIADENCVAFTVSSFEEEAAREAISTARALIEEAGCEWGGRELEMNEDGSWFVGFCYYTGPQD